MNGDKAAANAISQVIQAWASEQGEKRKEIALVKRQFGLMAVFVMTSIPAVRSMDRCALLWSIISLIRE